MIRLANPPDIKILEALSALGDGRVKVVEMTDDRVVLRITSSTGEKEYLVMVKRVSRNTFIAYSDDNGTRLRGYTGYPIIVALMLMRALPRSPDLEVALRKVRWKELNSKYKKYSVVKSIVLSRLDSSQRARVEEFVKEVYSRLRGLRVLYDESARREARLGA